MEKIVISCLESRVETNRSLYARFLLGPFQDDNAITIATALRRSLLSKVRSIAITAIHIQGVTHEFSTIVGVRESVLDLALNFQQVVLRARVDKQSKRDVSLNSINQRFKIKDNKQKLDQTLFNKDNSEQLHVGTVQIGYLQIQGPAVVYANDLKLPVGVECVDPTQYIATLSTEGLLVVKFTIGTKKASLDKNNGALTGKEIYVERESSSAFTESLGFKDSIISTPNVFQLNQTAQLESYPMTNPFRLFDPTICLRHTIFLDPIFNSVLQANYLIEKDDIFNQARERVILEFWTNGSIHPREALHKSSLSLISTFSIFRKVFHLDSL